MVYCPKCRRSVIGKRRVHHYEFKRVEEIVCEHCGWVIEEHIYYPRRREVWKPTVVPRWV